MEELNFTTEPTLSRVVCEIEKQREWFRKNVIGPLFIEPVYREWVALVIYQRPFRHMWE